MKNLQATCGDILNGSCGSLYASLFLRVNGLLLNMVFLMLNSYLIHAEFYKIITGGKNESPGKNEF